jgi:hypothetical protein
LNRQGKEALAGGDWEGFGRAQAELERLLERLERETPGTTAEAGSAGAPDAAGTPGAIANPNANR